MEQTIVELGEAEAGKGRPNKGYESVGWRLILRRHGKVVISSQVVGNPVPKTAGHERSFRGDMSNMVWILALGVPLWKDKTLWASSVQCLIGSRCFGACSSS